MAELKIRQGDTLRSLSFSGEQTLEVLLEQAGIFLRRPCGGLGTCGKCAVTLRGQVSAPNEREEALGCRLACQARILGDAEVVLPRKEDLWAIETGGRSSVEVPDPVEGRLALAVDIGTTTLACRLLELKTGRSLAEAAGENPQTAVAADVMGRIQGAMEGKLPWMQEKIRQAIQSLLEEACRQAVRDPEQVDRLLLTGNTTMLYLLLGKSPACLAKAPFLADETFGYETEFLGRRAYLPPCMNAFVGADITCGVLVSGMCSREETALLCDVGTNGELALWHGGRLSVTSTAAGPAFEGAGIRWGCGSSPGAICRAEPEGETLRCETIGGEPPRGICGSGLLDAVAAGLDLGKITETGAMPEKVFPLAGPVALYPEDIRAVQLAKAAIRAGIQVLLHRAGLEESQVERIYLAGGFGSRLRLTSAVRVGLIPEDFLSRVEVLGNAALAGAEALLLDRKKRKEAERIAALAQGINLGGSQEFMEQYVEHMLFGTWEEEE